MTAPVAPPPAGVWSIVLPAGWEVLSEARLQDYRARLPEALAADPDADAAGITASLQALADDVAIGQVQLQAWWSLTLLRPSEDTLVVADADAAGAELPQTLVATVSVRVASHPMALPDVARRPLAEVPGAVEVLAEGDAGLLGGIDLAHYGPTVLHEHRYAAQTADGIHVLLTCRSSALSYTGEVERLFTSIARSVELLR